MSMVHISLKKLDDAVNDTYEVLSMDFNKEAEIEKIGMLLLDSNLKTFKFESENLEKENFYPPEYFIETDGDYDEAMSRCKREGFNCLAWSYNIYKKAMRLLEDNN
jgi:hypothetical protein